MLSRVTVKEARNDFAPCTCSQSQISVVFIESVFSGSIFSGSIISKSVFGRITYVSDKHYKSFLTF